LFSVEPKTRLNVTIVNGVRRRVVPVAILAGEREVVAYLVAQLNFGNPVNNFRVTGL
jgi:hypothetical protein